MPCFNLYYSCSIHQCFSFISLYCKYLRFWFALWWLWHFDWLINRKKNGVKGKGRFNLWFGARLYFFPRFSLTSQERNSELLMCFFLCWLSNNWFGCLSTAVTDYQKAKTINEHLHKVGWLTSIFSLEYQYIIKQTGDENKVNRQLGDILSLVVSNYECLVVQLLDQLNVVWKEKISLNPVKNSGSFDCRWLVARLL